MRAGTVKHAQARISHINMRQKTDDPSWAGGYDATCTVVTDDPPLTLGTFIATDIHSKEEAGEKIAGELTKFLRNLSGEFQEERRA